MKKKYIFHWHKEDDTLRFFLCGVKSDFENWHCLNKKSVTCKRCKKILKREIYKKELK